MPKIKKDNQTITRSANSKQFFKIKAFWRVHGEGTWKASIKHRRLKSASHSEITNFQVCVLSVAGQLDVPF